MSQTDRRCEFQSKSIADITAGTLNESVGEFH